jgi:hypothetical protein
MAHFAEIDDNNVVLRVIVVSNDEIRHRGFEREERGIAFCKSLFGQETNWVQTSYNAKFRGKYAAVGDLYDKASDSFVS